MYKHEHTRNEADTSDPLFKDGVGFHLDTMHKMGNAGAWSILDSIYIHKLDHSEHNGEDWDEETA